MQKQKIQGEIQAYLQAHPVTIKTRGHDDTALITAHIDCEIQPGVWVLSLDNWLVSTGDYMHFLKSVCGIKARVQKIDCWLADDRSEDGIITGLVLYFKADIWHHTDEIERESIKAPLVLYLDASSNEACVELGKLFGMPFDKAVWAFDPMSAGAEPFASGAKKAFPEKHL